MSSKYEKKNQVRNIWVRKMKILLESSKYESSKVWNYEIIYGLSFVIIFVFPDSLTTV